MKCGKNFEEKEGEPEKAFQGQGGGEGRRKFHKKPIVILKKPWGGMTSGAESFFWRRG